MTECLVQESAGNFDLSIQYLQKCITKLEELRSSYKVKQRVGKSKVIENDLGIIRNPYMQIRFTAPETIASIVKIMAFVFLVRPWEGHRPNLKRGEK